MYKKNFLKPIVETFTKIIGKKKLGHYFLVGFFSASLLFIVFQQLFAAKSAQSSITVQTKENDSKPSSQNTNPLVSNKDKNQNSQIDILPNFWDDRPSDELALAIIDAMTDEELFAQTLMFGWAGLDPSPLVIDWVQERSLGSIKIFGWNTDNTQKVAESISLLQKKSAQNRFGIPLFVATDQEGGWIRHIKGRTSETPGNLALGASGIPADAWYSGYYISRELAALGINLNFAPAVDLYTDHESTVIGPRSFGEDPVSAGILGASFMAGSLEAGVLTTAKHFPGHGDTGSDSHGQLPVIHISKKTLNERELVPFKLLIQAGIPTIMSGHLSFPKICPNGEPATFSKTLLTDLLRNELEFSGLIITDDIMMNGATTWAGSVSKAVQLALEAGNNIIESSTTPTFNEAIWTKNIELIKKSPTFKSCVKDSAKRIIKAKLDYFKSPKAVPLYPDLAKINERIPDPEGQQFFISMAARSVTFVRAKDLPLKQDDFGTILIASNFPDFLTAGSTRYPSALRSGINSELYRKARACDTVIVSVASESDLRYVRDLQYLDATIIIVSLLSPVLLEDIPWAKNAIAIYSYAPDSFKAAFGAIAGDFVAEGIMPLKDIL